MVTCTKWGFYEHVGNTWIMSTVGLRTKNCKYLIFSFFLLQFYFLFRYNFHRVQWVNILMNLWTHIHAHRWNHNPYRDGAFLIHQLKLPQVPSHSSDLIPEILNFHVSVELFPWIAAGLIQSEHPLLPISSISLAHYNPKKSLTFLLLILRRPHLPIGPSSPLWALLPMLWPHSQCDPWGFCSLSRGKRLPGFSVLLFQVHS